MRMDSNRFWFHRVAVDRVCVCVWYIFTNRTFLFPKHFSFLYTFVMIERRKEEREREQKCVQNTFSHFQSQCMATNISDTKRWKDQNGIRWNEKRTCVDRVDATVWWIVVQCVRRRTQHNLTRMTMTRWLYTMFVQCLICTHVCTLCTVCSSVHRKFFWELSCETRSIYLFIRFADNPIMKCAEKIATRFYFFFVSVFTPIYSRLNHIHLSPRRDFLWFLFTFSFFGVSSWVILLIPFHRLTISWYSCLFVVSFLLRFFF